MFWHRVWLLDALGIWEGDHFVCPLPFVKKGSFWGTWNLWKINGRFSIHWIALPTLSCVSVYFFVSLFFLPNISNPHTPTLEHINLSRQDSKTHGISWHPSDCQVVDKHELRNSRRLGRKWTLDIRNDETLLPQFGQCHCIHLCRI